jgi:hypothetical protein
VLLTEAVATLGTPMLVLGARLPSKPPTALVTPLVSPLPLPPSKPLTVLVTVLVVEAVPDEPPSTPSSSPAAIAGPVARQVANISPAMKCALRICFLLSVAGRTIPVGGPAARSMHAPNLRPMLARSVPGGPLSGWNCSEFHSKFIANLKVTSQV